MNQYKNLIKKKKKIILKKKLNLNYDIEINHLLINNFLIFFEKNDFENISSILKEMNLRIITNKILVDKYFIKSKIIEKISYLILNFFNSFICIDSLILLSSISSLKYINFSNFFFLNNLINFFEICYNLKEIDLLIPYFTILYNIIIEDINNRNEILKYFNINLIENLLNINNSISYQIIIFEFISSICKYELNEIDSLNYLIFILNKLNINLDEEIINIIIKIISFINNYFNECFEICYKNNFFNKISLNKFKENDKEILFLFYFYGIAFEKYYINLNINNIISLLKNKSNKIIGNGIWLLWLISKSSDLYKFKILNNKKIFKFIWYLLDNGNIKEKEISLCLLSELIQILPNSLIIHFINYNLIDLIIEMINFNDNDLIVILSLINLLHYFIISNNNNLELIEYLNKNDLFNLINEKNIPNEIKFHFEKLLIK